MYGHEGVSRDLRRRVLSAMPTRLAMIRERTGADGWALPDPVQVLPYFLPDIDIDSYPTICVTELDTPTGLTGARQLRQGTSWEAYVYRYPTRIWCHLKAETYGAAELMLKRYLTAIRELILTDRVLTDTDDAYVFFDPETIVEEFDTPLEDESRAVLIVGFVGVVLESTEIIRRAESGAPTLAVRGEVFTAHRVDGEPTGEPSTTREVDLWR